MINETNVLNLDGSVICIIEKARDLVEINSKIGKEIAKVAETTVDSESTEVKLDECQEENDVKPITAKDFLMIYFKNENEEITNYLLHAGLNLSNLDHNIAVCAVYEPEEKEKKTFKISWMNQNQEVVSEKISYELMKILANAKVTSRTFKKYKHQNVVSFGSILQYLLISNNQFTLNFIKLCAADANINSN